MIISTRSVRYGFDIYLDVFKINDLISLHICHIDLILLVICLINPQRKIFIFTYLIGIPTALSVALMPGTTHFAPGLLRAIFFISSHMMLVMGSIYLLKTMKYKIKLKEFKIFTTLALGAIILMYFYNKYFNSNFMYLNKAPQNTVLESIFNFTGPFFYIVILYLIFIALTSTLYFLNIKLLRNNN